MEAVALRMPEAPSTLPPGPRTPRVWQRLSYALRPYATVAASLRAVITKEARDDIGVAQQRREGRIDEAFAGQSRETFGIDILRRFFIEPDQIERHHDHYLQAKSLFRAVNGKGKDF